MKHKFRVLLMLLLCLTILAGCGGTSNVIMQDNASTMSESEALKELKVLADAVKPLKVDKPKMDIYTDEISEIAALAPVDTFDIVVKGNGTINIEIAAATELTADAPDDWLIAVARNFNNSGVTVNGKSTSVSLRKITSGEIVTYVNAQAYRPNVAITSNDCWGKMIDATGIGITKICDRIAGNTAGILLDDEAYNTVKDKYGDVSLGTVIAAASAGDIEFAYPNPYTSSTGLNGLTGMLAYWDPKDPLSATASNALLEYQKTSPPVAYTTAVLRNQAAKGIINAMLMEEQAYINTPSLSDYHYIPFGVRHDHPVYTFEWNTAEENQVAELFKEFCLTEESQKLATEKGFNRHDDYKSQDSGLSGQGYLTAQSLWKQNKSGGRPIMAVFVCDVSGSMNGERLGALQDSIVKALPYIGSEHYIGLVSYSTKVTKNLPIAQFDAKQRAKFSGEVRNFTGTGTTHTYDAVVVGLQMLEEKLQEVPDAVPVLFLLTDGELLGGYTLDRIEPVVGGLHIPIHTIAYNYDNMEELERLSNINEASTTRADSSDIVNHLRNLFTTQL